MRGIYWLKVPEYRLRNALDADRVLPWFYWSGETDMNCVADVVATSRDDTAVLATLTARELNPRAKIVASIRESENTHLMRQSGANSVVVSSETAGRLLGIATMTPSVVEVIEDLLTPDAGYAIAEREVDPTETGGSPAHTRDIVLGVVRNGVLHRVDDSEVEQIEVGDRLLYVRTNPNDD